MTGYRGVPINPYLLSRYQPIEILLCILETVAAASERNVRV